MPLPILSHHPKPTPQDLVRFYHRCDLHWHRHLAEDETALDVGVALSNREFPQVDDANLILDASLPPGMSPADAAKLVDDHFAAAGTRCGKWVLNPSAPPEQTQPVADHLLATGQHREDQDVMYLAARPAGAIEEVGGLTIIPARASYRHVRELVAEATAGRDIPKLADAEMLHFEDPQTDALLAMKDDTPVAWVSVLTVGEMGEIEDLFVSAKFRRQGIGRTMMSRALEICARSLFKHVFLSCEPTNLAAINLYKHIGFTRIGTFTTYRHARP